MILIISTCFDKLSEMEFVKPILELVKEVSLEFVVKHFLDVTKDDLERVEKVIISGCALKDFEYLSKIEFFNWIKDFGKPILGICSGMQIIGKTFGCELENKFLVGCFESETVLENELIKGRFKSYFLFSKSVKVQEFDVLAVSGDLPVIIKKDQIYGCLFHPEVLNPEIIFNFLNI